MRYSDLVNFYYGCLHRKYGEVYDTYSTINSYWYIQVWPGKWIRIKLFGILKRCDLCGKQMLRYPWWEPKIEDKYRHQKFKENTLPWSGWAEPG